DVDRPRLIMRKGATTDLRPGRVEFDQVALIGPAWIRRPLERRRVDIARRVGVRSRLKKQIGWRRVIEHRRALPRRAAWERGNARPSSNQILADAIVDAIVL